MLFIHVVRIPGHPRGIPDVCIYIYIHVKHTHIRKYTHVHTYIPDVCMYIEVIPGHPRGLEELCYP